MFLNSIIKPDLWLMSDHHFGHANIGIYEPLRNTWKDLGYTSHEHMLIAKHNEAVKPSDTALFLGDFAWKDPLGYSKHLLGSKHLVLGNHDRKGEQPYRDFVKVYNGYYVVIKDTTYYAPTLDPLVSCIIAPYDDKLLVFSHYAIGYDDPYDHQGSGMIQIRKDKILKALNDFNKDKLNVINIHGHLHSHLAVDNTVPGITYRNVSAERTMFAPVRLRDVINNTY